MLGSNAEVGRAFTVDGHQELAPDALVLVVDVHCPRYTSDGSRYLAHQTIQHLGVGPPNRDLDSLSPKTTKPERIGPRNPGAASGMPAARFHASRPQALRS